MSIDLLRYAITGGAILLSLAIGPCLIWAPDGWEQRLRFVALLGYGIVSAGGQINNLGTPPRWTTILLGVVTVVALVGTAGHLLRVRTALRQLRRPT